MKDGNAGSASESSLDSRNSPSEEQTTHIADDLISNLTGDFFGTNMDDLSTQNGYVHLINSPSQTMGYAMPSQTCSTDPLQMQATFAPSNVSPHSSTTLSPYSSESQFSPTGYTSAGSDNLNSISMHPTNDQELELSPNSDESLVSPNPLTDLGAFNIEDIITTNHALVYSQYEPDAIPIGQIANPRQIGKHLGMSFFIKFTNSVYDLFIS